MPLNLVSEFSEIVKYLDDGTAMVQYCALEKHFSIAKAKDYSFSNCDPVLGISIGGSSTKVMLCRTIDGVFRGIALVAENNPSEMCSFHEFLDKILMDSPQICEYLTESETVCVGISMPMAMRDGVPFHATKVETLSGLIARNDEDLKVIPTIEDNFKAYISKYNSNANVVFKCQSDATVAHLGAVAVSSGLRLQDKSFLAVCGTGFATSDENNYISPTLVSHHLDDDELYPLSDTENGQFMYAVAGKGIYAIMRRAISIASKSYDAGEGLENAEKYFLNRKATKLVFDLWSISACNAKVDRNLSSVRDDLGELVFDELVRIANPIGNRAVNALAASIVATMLHSGTPENNGNTYIYFEGSIATNPYVLSKIKLAIKSLIHNDDLYKQIGKKQPKLPIVDVDTAAVLPSDDGIESEMLKEIDFSVIGACALAITQGIILR